MAISLIKLWVDYIYYSNFPVHFQGYYIFPYDLNSGIRYSGIVPIYAVLRETKVFPSFITFETSPYRLQLQKQLYLKFCINAGLNWPVFFLSDALKWKETFEEAKSIVNTQCDLYTKNGKSGFFFSNNTGGKRQKIALSALKLFEHNFKEMRNSCTLFEIKIQKTPH